MSKIMIAGLLGLSFWGAYCQSVLPAPRTNPEIKNALRQCVDKQNRTPGIVVGVIDENGTRVFAYGKRERGKVEEVNGDTIFEIGSITKVFTTLLLQDMVERGEVKLEDPIGKFLPADVKTPTRGGKQITLQDLATHTSGLPSMPDNLSVKSADNPWADYTVGQMYDFLSHYKLRRTPGSKCDYSNYGMGLLGHILALRAGTNYESLVINRICEPLHMHSTRMILSAELKSHLAAGHSVVGPPVKNWDSLALQGDGAFYSSVNDMLKFLAANMGRGDSPLSAAMAKTQAPLRRMGFCLKVGLGWVVYSGFGAHYTWHNGGTGGYRSYIAFDREKRRGVIVLANEANDVDDIGRYLFLPDIFQSIDEFETPRQRTVARMDPQIYDRYIGHYQFNSKQFLTIAREGERLMAQESGPQEFPTEIFPGSETEFFATACDAQVTFIKNQAGVVSQLVIHQERKQRKAKKVNGGE